MSPASPNVYSPKRFRLVVALLTLVTLPAVFGAAVLIFYYQRFSVMIERRLQGERFMVPARIYARPLTLRPGLHLTPERLVKVLNGLKYEQKSDGPAAAGEFVASNKSVSLFPRPSPDGANEPITVVFDKERVKEIRGVRSRKPQPSQTLEPELVTYLFDESREKRRLVRYEELPEHLIQAVLAIEDRRFFSHPGLDPFRIVGAAVKNIRAESYLQGGSTITQQLVKNFFLTPERTFRRKVQEALLAFVLERRATKQEILQLYLNEIYLGQAGSFSINGVGEAARVYFQKDVGNVSLPEAALLAGMIRAPNPYNPGRHPQRAMERRNLVLRAMQESGFISEATAEAATAQPLRVESAYAESVEAPYFVDLVRSQLQQRYDAKNLTTQSLSVYTTLDLRLQSAAQETLRAGLHNVEKLLKRKQPRPPVQGSLIAIEPESGAVVALVGGRSYEASQFNRVVQARRQPGSTFKPFVYLAAFEAFFDDQALPPITPATIVEDTPTVFFFEDKEYIPQNYEDEYLGFVTLRRALSKSLNVATVKVAEMVGFDRVADVWSKKMGIGGEIHPYPAVALGSFEATPFELATAYNVLANGGLKVEPLTILRVADAKGQAIEQHRTSFPERVIHEESAFLVTSMLQSVLSEGTGAASRAMGFSAVAAGKTGTTNDMRDAWFAGYTPNLLCVVWVGFDDNAPLDLPGARAALPIWVEFMKAALAGTEPAEFAVPSDGIVFAEICRETGLLAAAGCPKPLNEAFIIGTEPREWCRAH